MPSCPSTTGCKHQAGLAGPPVCLGYISEPSDCPHFPPLTSLQKKRAQISHGWGTENEQRRFWNLPHYFWQFGEMWVEELKYTWSHLNSHSKPSTLHSIGVAWALTRVVSQYLNIPICLIGWHHFKTNWAGEGEGFQILQTGKRSFNGYFCNLVIRCSLWRQTLLLTIASYIQSSILNIVSVTMPCKASLNESLLELCLH